MSKLLDLIEEQFLPQGPTDVYGYLVGFCFYGMLLVFFYVMFLVLFPRTIWRRYISKYFTPQSRRIAIDVAVVSVLALIVYTVIWHVINPSEPYPCAGAASELACEARLLKGDAK